METTDRQGERGIASESGGGIETLERERCGGNEVSREMKRHV
jgi:hypothetical protein